MSHQNGENQNGDTRQAKPPVGDQPEVINLGNAATLTRGGEDTGVENKRAPYD
ncbi:albusnodin family lasso peptide [Streptomyces sp. S186]|uniref:albusnodin family lasso peptide n=1 Tax=Streptomyces sp. S186 TaxID=3434395 RepID=UPI003F67F33D